MKFENVDQEIESCEVSLNVLQQQVTYKMHLYHFIVLTVVLPSPSFGESFQNRSFLFVPAGEFVQPESPSDAGFNQEHNSSTRSSPVPSQQGPVLSLNVAPIGPRAYAAGDRCWQHPWTAEQ